MQTAIGGAVWEQSAPATSSTRPWPSAAAHPSGRPRTAVRSAVLSACCGSHRSLGSSPASRLPSGAGRRVQRAAAVRTPRLPPLCPKHPGWSPAPCTRKAHGRAPKRGCVHLETGVRPVRAGTEFVSLRVRLLVAAPLTSRARTVLRPNLAARRTGPGALPACARVADRMRGSSLRSDPSLDRTTARIPGSSRSSART